MSVLALAVFSGCQKANTSNCSLTGFTQDSSPPAGVVIGSSTNTYLAQEFYVPNSGSTSTTSITGVNLTLLKNGTGFTNQAGFNTVTVTLFPDSITGSRDTSTTGTPSSTAQPGASATVDLLNVSTTETQVDFKFPSAVSISTNQTYWIRASASYQVNPPTTNNVEWMQYSGTSPYTDGYAFLYEATSGTLWNYAGTEVSFEFFITNC